MKNINLNLTEVSEQNLAFIQEHQDIVQKTQAIRSAINFYASYLKKEDAKITTYTKPAKSHSVVGKKVTREEEEREKNIEMCVLDFEGVVTDEYGNEDPNGMYCKYDSFEQVTPKKIIKAPDMVNPLDRLDGLLASGEKYRNTNSRGVMKFLEQGGEFTLLEGRKDNE